MNLWFDIRNLYRKIWLLRRAGLCGHGTPHWTLHPKNHYCNDYHGFKYFEREHFIIDKALSWMDLWVSWTRHIEFDCYLFVHNSFVYVGGNSSSSLQATTLPCSAHKVALFLKTFVAPGFIAVKGLQEWVQCQRMMNEFTKLTEKSGSQFRLVRAFYIACLR